MTTLLDDVLARLGAMPEAERKAVEEEAFNATGKMAFVPSPGKQTDAYLSPADILLYGGKPGGGKTSLLIGLALNEHERSLIVRKHFTDLEGVIDNAKGIVGSSKGFVGGSRPKYHKPDGVIHFQGMAQGDSIDTGKQGTPYDFIGVDEGAQLPGNAIRMLLGWNRTTKPGQRCRMVIASNPPLDSVGDWLIDFFGPWLNEAHPNPAPAGEIRWFIINKEDRSQEVPGPEPVVIEGVEYSPHSRTFIPADLEDNPYIDAEDYRRRLQVMPEPYRSILTSGNFMYARQDAEFQVIPTAWVMEAKRRWKPERPNGVAMTALAVDIAQGGADQTTLSARYGGWFAPLVAKPGGETPDGGDIAILVIQNRRDGCPVIIDMGGGYGGGAKLRLGDNEIEATPYNGGAASTATSYDGAKLKFFNKRAEVWWRFREALNPEQEGGGWVSLPDDPELTADLVAPRFDPAYMQRGIVKIESKEDIKKRLGRSPDKGDAVTMCLAIGGAAILKAQRRISGHRPQVILGHQNKRRKR